MLPERHGSHLYSVSTISQEAKDLFKIRIFFYKLEKRKKEIPTRNAEWYEYNYAKNKNYLVLHNNNNNYLSSYLLLLTIIVGWGRQESPILCLIWSFMNAHSKWRHSSKRPIYILFLYRFNSLLKLQITKSHLQFLSFQCRLHIVLAFFFFWEMSKFWGLFLETFH